MPARKKPQPVNKHVVCSICGLDWEKHGEEPTLETCVDLLKAELSTRPRPWTFNQTPQVYGNTITSSAGIPLNRNIIGKAH